MNTEQIRITFGGETVIMSWNGAEASAPIKVDGNHIGRQTADARHRTSNAVLLAARATWPDVAWPELPSNGSDAIQSTEAWDDLEYAAQ